MPRGGDRPPRYDSLPDHVPDALSRERDHILGLPPADPAACVAQAWIEVMEAVPWRRAPARPLDTPRELRRTLDREHVGRDHEKDQALDIGESFPGGLPSGISVRYASIMDEVLTVALPAVVA